MAAKPGRKTKEMHHVSFRMPADVYQDYVTVAEARGVDLSALLNWVVVEHRPQLLMRHAEHEMAMLRATTVGLPQTAQSPDQQEALSGFVELIRQLQEAAAKLSKRDVGEEKSKAA